MFRKFARPLVLVLIGACASSTALDRGKSLFEEGRLVEAEAAYEEALEQAPEEPAALEGLRNVRRARVQAQLERVEGLLGRDALAEALGEALKARRMPLDLEDVDLTRRIDQSVAEAAQRAERDVAAWEESGQYLAAAILAQDIARASGAADRQAWARQVTERAVAHYEGLAKTLVEQGLPGSASVSLAVAGQLAQQMGKEFSRQVVESTWASFSDGVCFGAPTVALGARELEDAHPSVAARLSSTIAEELRTWGKTCGNGKRELGLRIDFSQAEVVDETKTQQYAKALPGSGIETTEVYFEERSTIETETYTDYETRVEKEEKRDCAPRPGKPPGCREWVEERTVQVPVEKTREVKRIKRIRKVRPKKGPFPEDKVLTYDVTDTVRAVTLAGRVSVIGTEKIHRFSVAIRSADSGNAEARGARMLIREDPLEVRTMEEVVGEASEKLAAEVLTAVKAALGEWTRADDELAQRRAREGQLPQAEEAYLRLLALGVGQGAHVDGFFQRRYGRPAAEVFGLLMKVLGRASVRAPSRGVTKTPKRALPSKKIPKKSDPAKLLPAKSSESESAPDPGAPPAPTGEEASGPSEEGEETPGGEALDPEEGGDKSPPDEEPSRGPIVPR